MARPAIPVPTGDVRVDNPDGVSRTFGNEVRHSLYDSRGGVYQGLSYGAFPDEDGALYGRRSNGDVR